MSKFGQMTHDVEESKQMSIDEYSGIPTTNLPSFLRNLNVQQ